MESVTILRPPSTGLSSILLSASEPDIPEGPDYEKLSTLYRCTGRSFPNSTRHNDSC